jgi:hypothetical protein
MARGEITRAFFGDEQGIEEKWQTAEKESTIEAGCVTFKDL